MPSLEIVTLAAAKEAGLKRYFTGVPCPRGHLTERFVSGRQCIECLRLKRPLRRQYPERHAKRCAAYNAAHAQEIKEMQRKHRLANRARYYTLNRNWYLANKDHANAYNIAWKKRRKLEDPSYRIAENMRGRVANLLRGRSKLSSTIAALGAPIGEVRAHLERMFSRGMSWQNYGRLWHIDHIRPLAGFDLTDPDQFSAAFNYLNLRPLRKRANLVKGAKRELLL